MTLTKKPVNGMKDILPQEMYIRDYLIGEIKKTYKSFGFTPIETPVVENIENLTSKQGGDNEKLIFKIMKRGQKFNLETAKNENDLTDSGLRYDLTVPLVRYYSNNANSLPKPFKALQIGPVFRADRPQKGRFREFYQCDIDTLGDASNQCEIELITATTTLLGRIGFENFTVHINDRRMLKAMAVYSGFPEDSLDQVFIVLDKMDKIGIDGVAQELMEDGFAKETVEKYVGLFHDLQEQSDPLEFLGSVLAGTVEEGTAENLKTICTSVEKLASVPFRMQFDPTLVRGMSYYTGTIFEITTEGLGSSVAGGGRYDKMVGRFTNIDTPACGFSIGFERIITILMDRNFQVPDAPERTAILLEKNMPDDRILETMQQAQKLRGEGREVLVTMMNKNKKHQKEQLAAEGYTDIREVYINPRD